MCNEYNIVQSCVMNIILYFYILHEDDFASNDISLEDIGRDCEVGYYNQFMMSIC